ncbi:MAG TPA: class I SAM-dependent methyltransferase [Gaiellales bacterium]|jgi:O-methyltransferase involved in polyketide biosynthesis|nr:class I SAM-dependent methyltransferase [Gaiellales bacterium]
MSMPVELRGVPETLVWTLYHRATEARRSDAVLHDPKAVELLDAIDFPFEQRFGAARAGLSQWQALRALTFDRQVERFLAKHPDGTIVALGEGLETQFWRVDNGRVQWVTVDLPEAIDVRRRLLPAQERQRVLACSALDPVWMDEIDKSRGVLVTAQGLLMYLEPADARQVITTCARRLPGGALVFDAVPRWLSERSRSGKLAAPGGYQPPPWNWWIDAGEKRALREDPHIADLQTLRLPRGRGALMGYIVPLFESIPGLRGAFFSIMRARFRP